MVVNAANGNLVGLKCNVSMSFLAFQIENVANRGKYLRCIFLCVHQINESVSYQRHLKKLSAITCI